MIVRIAYKYRLKPNAQQTKRLYQVAGCCRLVWNYTFEQQVKRLDQKRKVLSYADACGSLIELKKDKPFLRSAPSQALQQSVKHLDRAIQDGLAKTKGFPKFKKRGGHDSFVYPQGIKLKDDRIYLPKIGWMKFFKSREIEGKVKNVTVSRTGEHWYIAVQVEFEVATPRHPSQSEIGIDLGVVQFATFSDGTTISPVNSSKTLGKKLGRAQRELARKEKGSSNWVKQKIKVRKVHIKIANVRKDFLHKTSTTISKNHAVIVLEDLRISNMTRSAKGTLDKPGKNVAAKAGLNRSILDQGWNEFYRQLKYKQERLGGKVIEVNPMNTSQRCSRCKLISSENRKTQSHFQCVGCGHTANADLNAAINILAAGRAVIAYGDIRQVAV